MPIHPDTCAGPCSTAARKAWKAYDQAILDHADAIDAWAADGEKGDPPAEPEPPAIELRAGEPYLCRRCQAAVRAALVDLDALAAELQARADGHRGTTPEDRTSGSRSAASPSPVRDILDRLYGDLTDAEDEWRQAIGAPARTHRQHRGADRLSRTVGWLVTHLDGILAHEDHTTWALNVLRWEKVLRALAKEEPVGGKSPIRCPRCGQRRVGREKEGYWQCGACLTLLSDPYERQLRDEQGCELESAQIA